MKYLKLFDNYNCFNESVNIYGQKNIHFKKIYEAVVKYLISDIIGQDVDIKIYFKKMSKNEIGHVELYDTLKNIKDRKFKIYLNDKSGVFYQFGALAHEITHIKQILKGDISISDDNRYMMWKGIEYISVIDLMKLVDDYDFEIYKNLPWEKEAYHNQKLYSKKVKESDTLSKLKGESEQMDYIIDFIL